MDFAFSLFKRKYLPKLFFSVKLLLRFDFRARLSEDIFCLN